MGEGKIETIFVWPDKKVTSENFRRAYQWRVEKNSLHTIALILRIPEYGEWAKDVSESDLEAAVALVEKLQNPAPKASVELLLKQGAAIGLPVLTDLVKTFAKK
jgi:hypothetical protein